VKHIYKYRCHLWLSKYFYNTGHRVRLWFISEMAIKTILWNISLVLRSFELFMAILHLKLLPEGGLSFVWDFRITRIEISKLADDLCHQEKRCHGPWIHRPILKVCAWIMTRWSMALSLSLSLFQRAMTVMPAHFFPLSLSFYAPKESICHSAFCQCHSLVLSFFSFAAL
jgi:hypothetical protein